MALTPEDKAAKAMIDACADSRMNDVALAHRIGREGYDVNARFFNVLISFVYYHARNYEAGLFPNGTYEIASMCKKIKDIVFTPECPPVKYEKYGDYERDAHDLTQFDKA